MTVDRQLGLTILAGPGAVEALPSARIPTRATNTRTSLWPDRWPAIAKQSCIDIVEAVPDEEKGMVKFGLPCAACELSSMCLNSKSKELGTLLYDREILTTPRSSESTFFPRELFEPMLSPSLPMQRSYWKPEGREREIAVVQAWDLAWSERTGGDYLVCITAAVDLIRGHSTLLEIERWQRKSFDEQCKMIEAKWRQFRSNIVVIESDAAQTIWTQHMAATTPVPVVGHTAAGKRDLAHGVPSILIRLQNRKWTFPFQVFGYGYAEMENFLAEAEAFGWVNGKLEGVGEHDDTVMCFWHLSWGIDTMILGNVPLEGRLGTQPGRLQ